MRKVMIFFVLSSNVAFGQVNPPKQFNTTSTYSLTDTVRNFNIRERLVQLAMNNPSYEVSDRLTNVAAYQVRLMKGNWLSSISAQGNINEFTIDPKSAGGGSATTGYNPTIYPKYNFGISVPFDIITRNSNNVKIARENYLIAQAVKNDKFRQIKADVLTRYEDYLLARQKLELQIQITQEAYTSYQVAEDSFRKNLIKEDDYSKAYRNWVAEQITKLDLQRNLNVSKIDVERIIGVKLDDVLKENFQSIKTFSQHHCLSTIFSLSHGFVHQSSGLAQQYGRFNFQPTFIN
jgi:outer membrane protein TolC